MLPHKISYCSSCCSCNCCCCLGTKYTRSICSDIHKVYISLYILLLLLLRLYIKIQNLHHLNFSLFTAKGRRRRRRRRSLQRANQSPDVARAKLLLSWEDAASHEGVGGASRLLCMDMQDTDFGMFRLSLSLAGELRLNSVSCGVGNSNEGDAGAGAGAAGSTLAAAASAEAA